MKKNSTCVVTMIIFRNWNHAFHGHWRFKCHFQHGDMKKNRNFARKWTSLSCGIFPFLIDDNESAFILFLRLFDDILINGSVSRLALFTTPLLNHEKKKIMIRLLLFIRSYFAIALFISSFAFHICRETNTYTYFISE